MLFFSAQHNKKQGPYSLFLQSGNLPSSSCASIIIFSLTSRIDIEWCRLLFHGLLGDRFYGVGLHRIEDHGRQKRN
jgi:hypothetical protein